MNGKSQGFHISHIHSLWQDLSSDTNIFYLVTLTLDFDLLLKTLTLAITFEWCVIGSQYSTHIFLETRPFFWYQHFLPCDLDLGVWPIFKNFNLGYNFWMVGDRAFIFHMYIPCDKTFLLIPTFFTVWPWPWTLTTFLIL